MEAYNNVYMHNYKTSVGAMEWTRKHSGQTHGRMKAIPISPLRTAAGNKQVDVGEGDTLQISVFFVKQRQ